MIEELPGRYGNTLDEEFEEKRFLAKKYGPEYRDAAIKHFRWILTKAWEAAEDTKRDWYDVWLACQHAARALAEVAPPAYEIYRAACKLEEGWAPRAIMVQYFIEVWREMRRRTIAASAKQD